MYVCMYVCMYVWCLCNLTRHKVTYCTPESHGEYCRLNGAGGSMKASPPYVPYVWFFSICTAALSIP